MKYLKMLGLAAVAAMALTAFAASSASATTLEVNGVTQNQSVTLVASLETNTSAILSRTDGSLANTCTKSTAHGSTTVFTTTKDPENTTEVQGPLSEGGLTFSSCERSVVVHKQGALEVEHISGTTDGTVRSKDAEVTVGSIFGTLNCKTGNGVDIGRLTGTSTGHAKMDINAVLDCGFLVPSASWKGSYTITAPTGLGVSA